MLSKVKQVFKTDNFSYFIRYFGVFTLIFGLMTMIILQLMRGTVYQSSDENFKEFQNDPNLIVNFALARGIAADSDVVFEQGGTSSSSSSSQSDGEKQPPEHPYTPSTKLRLNTNYHVILYDSEGNILNTLDSLSGLSNVSLNKERLNEIYEESVTTSFGEEETYRVMTVKLSSDNPILSGINGEAYATVLFNTTQIKSSLASYEATVMIVMISFWLISIATSVYLATLSVKPILVSFQKQKDFVENASHELRTPLAVLQNRLEGLFRKPEATIMESSESIASSLEEVRNMRLLTTNLLNLARRDDGLKPDIVEISPEFFDEVFENYSLMALENGKTLEIEQHVSKIVRSDKTLLKQLMTILFDNALKYTEEGGHIFIRLTVKDRYLIFQVADDGIGISSEEKKKIFDRFYRVDKARTRHKGGFGLGLSLAKQISDSLNGTIAVSDYHPKGTMFEVHIPR